MVRSSTTVNDEDLTQSVYRGNKPKTFFSVLPPSFASGLSLSAIALGLHIFSDNLKQIGPFHCVSQVSVVKVYYISMKSMVWVIIYFFTTNIREYHLLIARIAFDEPGPSPK